MFKKIPEKELPPLVPVFCPKTSIQYLYMPGRERVKRTALRYTGKRGCFPNKIWI